MNNGLFYLGVIVLMVLIDAVAQYYAQVLYMRHYVQHITFEPTALFDVPVQRRLQGLVASLVICAFTPILFWMNGDTDSYAFYFLMGFLIMSLAFFISRAVQSIIMFLYLKNHPDQVTGKTVFQYPAAKMIFFVLMAQQVVMFSVLAFFVDSPFILGGLAGLTANAFLSFFIKQPRTTV